MIDLPTVGITIMLPFATPSQNVTQRWHWAKKAKTRDQARLIIRFQLSRLRLPDAAPRRAVIEVLRLGRRALDYGNLVGGFKVFLDAAVLEGLVHDDSPRWLVERYHQDKAPRGVEATRLWVYPTVER